MNILVTGGAGYIGSHAVLELIKQGDKVTVLDDLSTGRRSLVSPAAKFVQGDFGDSELVSGVLARDKIDAVIHFAGSAVVPESITNPAKYYDNNTAKSLRFIQACVAADIGAFVFSSTAAVYGAPEDGFVNEQSPLSPINPYGRSKLMIEWILEDMSRAHGLPYAALRYFNVAGADPLKRTGQATPNATHLIKVACEVATGKRRHLEIYGSDYATRDGTCVRDYIHVSDLIDAHIQSLSALRGGLRKAVLNCGYGKGYTVLEVVAALEGVIERKIEIMPRPRRAGDSPYLIADSSAIRTQLGWRPQYDDLSFIIRTALDWEREHKSPRSNDF